LYNGRNYKEYILADPNLLAGKAGQAQVGGISVNRLGLGTNRITDTEEARDLLRGAVELGVNFIDTAHTYQNGASETTIGRTLAPYPDDLLIATKGGMNGASPDQLRIELETSLRRLKTDCIDLYQLHRVDPTVPLETTMHALRQFKDEGKLRYVGLSEVDVSQIEKAQQSMPISSIQNEYNLAKRQHETVLDYCTNQEIIFIPWFPLGGLRGDTAKVNELTEEFAKKYEASPQQIAHLIANLKAASIQLSQADYQSLYDS
jgi:aryl-alcohol dehydrogenase-like predicted oxidoreductase